MKVDPNFNPIYDLDGYTYIRDIIPKNEVTTIHFITGGDAYPARSNEVFDETIYVYLDIRVDVVQANRFVEKWGISSDYFN